MKMRFMLIGLMVPVFSVASTEAIEKFPACNFEADKSFISEDEFKKCLLENDPVLKKMSKDDVSPRAKAQADATDMAAEAIQLAPSRKNIDGKMSMSFSDAESYLKQRTENLLEPTDLKFGWDSFRIGRKLSDAVDPRKKKYPAAFIISYVNDKEKSSDSFVALGDVTWFSQKLDNATQLDLKSSIDVATAKPASESTVDFSASFGRLWVFNDSILTSLNASIEPKYSTDRDFRRDVVQLSATLTPSSQRLLNAGYNTTLGKPTLGFSDNFGFYWQPALAVEVGSINDAGGNASLEALQEEGSYTRIAPSVEIKLLWPRRIPLTLNVGYTHRYDMEQHWDRGSLTSGFQYDIAKNFALTLTYREGRKPDTFDKIHEVLFGVGVTLSD